MIYCIYACVAIAMCAGKKNKTYGNPAISINGGVTKTLKPLETEM